jgi:RNA polymerase sigma factor for flagellar operon FliA
MVRTVAAGVRRPRHLDLDELESHASLGLLDALDRYDPSRGPFEPYAKARMRGAVIDGIREHDRASRTHLKRAKALDAAVDELTGKLHRPPNDAELAARLGVDTEGLRSFHYAQLATTVGTLDVHNSALFSNDNGDGGGAGAATVDSDWAGIAAQTLSDHADVAAEVELRLMKTALASAIHAAISRIDGPGQAVFVLYYVEELTMSQIAKVLGVATARVSQIHSRAVRELKAMMEPALPGRSELP